MANTGQLGTKDAQPGSIELGIGPPNELRTFVTTTSVLGQAIAKPGTFKLGSINSSAVGYFTQDVVEVIYVTASDAHVTQDVVEVIYGQRVGGIDVDESVSDSATVGQTIDTEITSSSNAARVTHEIAEVIYQTASDADVTQDVVEVIYGYDRTQQSVIHNIAVDQTVTSEERSISLTVTSNVTVGQTIAQRDTVIHETITDNIAVTQTARNNEIHETVTSGVTVSQTCFGRNNVIRLSVVTSIDVSVPGSGHDDTDHQTITTVVTVGQTVAAHATTSRTAITDNVTVSQTVIGRNTNNRQSVTHALTVGSLVTYQQPNLLVASNVTVGQTIDRRSTGVIKTVSTDVAVTSSAIGRPNPNRQSVTDSITIPEFYPVPAMAYISPRKMFVNSAITVTDAIGGGSSNREISVTDNVHVDDNAFRRQFNLHVIDEVTVSWTFGGGNSHRIIEVVDTVNCWDVITARDNKNRQSVQDRVFVTPTITGHGPIVNLALASDIHIFQFITVRVVPRIEIIDTISVRQTVAMRASPNNQFVTDNVRVNERLHQDPTSLALFDNVTVTDEVRNLELTVQDNIRVTQSLHRTFSMRVSDAISVNQTLARKLVLVRNVVDRPTIISTADRQVQWGRSLQDTLTIPDGFFTREISISPDPITVPVAIGTLVTKFITLRSLGSAITLPAPQLSDTSAQVAKTTVQRSMNANKLVLKQSTDRQQLVYSFRISKVKAFELRAFISAHLSDVIDLTTWDGEQWKVLIPKDPFELAFAGRSKNEDEFVTIEITFEGVKVSG